MLYRWTLFSYGTHDCLGCSRGANKKQELQKNKKHTMNSILLQCLFHASSLFLVPVR